MEECVALYSKNTTREKTRQRCITQSILGDLNTHKKEFKREKRK